MPQALAKLVGGETSMRPTPVWTKSICNQVSTSEPPRSVPVAMTGTAMMADLSDLDWDQVGGEDE
eukprot:6380878-Alexandrium_andersonii.AAC.1